MDATRSCKAGINEAARKYSVPSTTLKDRISGRIKHGTRPGPKKYFNDIEEEELSMFFDRCFCYWLRKVQRCMGIAEEYARSKSMFRKDKITNGWRNSFKNRQPDLLLQIGDNTAHVCMDAINEITTNHYFTLLKELLETHDLIPAQIYNVDESGMPSAPNVIAREGKKS